MPRSRGSNRRPASASGYFVDLPKMPTVGNHLEILSLATQSGTDYRLVVMVTVAVVVYLLGRLLDDRRLGGFGLQPSIRATSRATSESPSGARGVWCWEAWRWQLPCYTSGRRWIRRR